MSSDLNDSSYTRYRDWKGWDPERFGVSDTATRIYFEAEFRRCGIRDFSELMVLELGFGSGRFAAWAHGRGARYFGTERIPELLLQARERGFDVHDASEGLASFIANESIDLAVAFDVFEHVDLEALGELLRSIRIGLKPGGQLVGRIPSGDSPFSRAIQHGDLTHLTLLASSSIVQLADEVGLEVVQIREPVFPIFGMGLRVSVRRLAVAFFRALVYPIITHALMGGGHPVLTPNILFVLRRP